MQLESMVTHSTVMQLPSLFFGVIFLFTTMSTLVANAPFHVVLAFTEGIKGLIGWAFLAFFLVKYNKLNKLNANNHEMKVDIGVAIANEEVRRSVIV